MKVIDVVKEMLRLSMKLKIPPTENTPLSGGRDHYDG
jgi:hypothetical protein